LSLLASLSSLFSPHLRVLDRNFVDQRDVQHVSPVDLDRGAAELAVDRVNVPDF